MKSSRYGMPIAVIIRGCCLRSSARSNELCVYVLKICAVVALCFLCQTEECGAYQLAVHNAAARATRAETGIWSKPVCRCPIATYSSSSNIDFAPANLLEQLQRRTTIWADTADVGEVAQLARGFGIADVTTNPSIVFATARKDMEEGLGTLVAQARQPGASPSQTAERIAVNLGRQLLREIPGRVCTQVDIRCEDTKGIVAKARNLVELYTKVGIAKERILIKTPATWEGICATQRLEEEGIKCLVTLVCSHVQGRAAAEAGASIIATYVGRVSDWHKKGMGIKSALRMSADQDPGVLLTTGLQHYIRRESLRTEVMAASFRSVEQVVELAGCDHLTIAPALIQELVDHPPIYSLATSEATSPERSSKSDREMRASPLGVTDFVEHLAQDVCGTDVLRASVDGFMRDTVALEDGIMQC